MTCQGSRGQLRRGMSRKGSRKGRLWRWLCHLSRSSQGHSVDGIWGRYGWGSGRKGGMFPSSSYSRGYGIFSDLLWCDPCACEYQAQWTARGGHDEASNFLFHSSFPSSSWYNSQLLHSSSTFMHTHEHYTRISFCLRILYFVEWLSLWKYYDKIISLLKCIYFN